ncbi:hypothetical protein ABT56_02570 [Photobacterium aquae]|uniref:TonB-dependent receptor n=1 Tax=Photobacterium aquae TaxID=1195763 RepID=A0A0J1K3V9_9GAMM|nr:hypothetical protein [Photobacterium aquae]KLV09097.1 hypothetical protein ABT56_02570 [Photobacterium aquae]
MKKILFSTMLLGLFANSVLANDFSLPIWKDKAEALGYVLPEPIGISVGYMTMEQGIEVDSIALTGLPKSNIFKLGMDAKPGIQKTDVLSLRADTWIFPFLNVYAMAGVLKGYSKTDVDASVSVNLDLPWPLPSIDKTYTGTIKDFTLDLDGYTTGFGMVLAGGYGNWFSLVDASFTQSSLTVIDGQIDAIVISPRLGYDFASHGAPIRVWVGAMYQDVEQNLSGNLSDLGLPPQLSALMPEDARFEVKQHLTTQWNPLLGMQYQVNKHWYLLGEAGLGERQSLFVSLEHRF